mgnify:CR=1 FL=1|jgi:hypothetical protein
MEDDSKNSNGQRRLRHFVIHLGVYALGMLVLVPLNLLTNPESKWALFPMVGWGSVLALHVAYVMGLFDIFKKGDE